MRFKTLLPLVDFAGLEQLKGARVCVVGVGGVGSYSAMALARSGIGHLIIVDPDTIEEANINRQLMALDSTIGQLKVAWLHGHLTDINPALTVDALEVAYNEDTSDQLFDLHPDYIIDAIDDMPAKKHLINACLAREIPCLSVLAQGNRLGSGLMHHMPLYKTHSDPIAKALRKTFNAHPAYKTIEVIYNDAPVDLPPDGAGCVASSIFSPAMAGLKAAEIIVKKVLT